MASPSKKPSSPLTIGSPVGGRLRRTLNPAAVLLKTPHHHHHPVGDRYRGFRPSLSRVKQNLLHIRKNIIKDDERYKYLINHLSSITCLDLPSVENFICIDDTFETLETFFNGQGERKCLTYFYQQCPGHDYVTLDGNRLFMANPATDALTGVCITFLRSYDNFAPLNGDTISQELNVNTLDVGSTSMLNAIASDLKTFMIPRLRAMATENWGHLANTTGSEEYISQLEKFREIAVSADTSIRRKEILTKTDKEHVIDMIKSPLECQRLARNRELVVEAEHILDGWLQQIEHLLTINEQMRRESSDAGPAAEVIYWKGRWSQFANLVEEIKMPRCQAVIRFLHVAKSRKVHHFRALDARVTVAVNEARDNVKYLQTLDNFVSQLARCSPSQMVEHLPGLMNAITMIYNISQYYNTSDRITSLFIKITNEMIRTCRNFLSSGTKIWNTDRKVLEQRVEECTLLNRKYQEAFKRVKVRLRESHNSRNFEFSENYVFGKFDNFCTRLDNVLSLLNTIDSYSALATIKLEGLEPIMAKFDKLAEVMKTKTYDFLDIRMASFDTDFEDFQNQLLSINEYLYKYIDAWFAKPLTVERFVDLLIKFEHLDGIDIDLSDKYSTVILRFEDCLLRAKADYAENCHNPPISRNLPPISSKIAWARQLYYSIETPMALLKKHRKFMEVPGAKRVISTYNKVAALLVQYEQVYYKGWCSAIDSVMLGLTSTVLVQDRSTGRLFTNFDPKILELLDDARYLQKLKFDIPETADILVKKAPKLKHNKLEIDEILKEYELASARIPPTLVPIMPVIRSKFERGIEPGLLTVTWRSVSIDDFIKTCHVALREFSDLVMQLDDLMRFRIEKRLRDVAEMPLIEMPNVDEPVKITDLVAQTEERTVKRTQEIGTITSLVESSVLDLLAVLHSLQDQRPQTASSRAHSAYMTGYFKTLAARELSIISKEGAVTPPLGGEEAKPRALQRCGDCENCIFFSIMNQLTQQKTDALFRCAALALDTLRRRLQQQQDFYGSKRHIQLAPVFYTDLVLVMPNIVLKPSLDEMQQSIGRILQAVLKVPQSVPLWYHQKQQMMSMLNKECDHDDDPQVLEQLQQLHSRQVSEHKDILRHMALLPSIISSNKAGVDKIIREFDIHSDLWQQEPAAGVAEFVKTNPSYFEYESIIKAYHAKEMELEDNIKPSYQLGPLLLLTDNLKLALIQEARLWKIAYGKSLNMKTGQQLSELMNFYEVMTVRLSRPVRDLDDISKAMDALAEVRDSEVRLGITLRPIEEAQAMLQKMELVFADSNAEKVDSLNYGWKKVQALGNEVTAHIHTIQPNHRISLLKDIRTFRNSVTKFTQDYNTNGPMEQGIAPREASDRMNRFQSQFDDLWSKFETYSSGEKLFGLVPTQYPDLHRIKRELNLLQKLYHLYNQVLESVQHYYEISWQELNIEKINHELSEFTSRCRKLPKALKEWRAYEDLSRIVNDLSETCPLLDLMSNKAMQRRHWERIETLTSHRLDFESETFCLRDLLKAPLLKYREDVEDICISAVKEKDIDAKLKSIVGDWSSRQFAFASFKTKGELLLKGETIAEIVIALEDSLMALGGLMSNRYNTPFKPNIQEWVNKLSSVSEIIERWMYVQNLWIYLEAVFVGGDIAKQLPGEAKRFTNIDKSWHTVMRHAHENALVVSCCTSDETLNQLLPHLAEQLELCQKALGGYLEKKRLVFPRFFFVSDPQLLEILGQASDSHTIQGHLLSIFDNTKQVKFDETHYDKICAIVSSEGEMIQLHRDIWATGNVENWLCELMKESRNSINGAIKSAWMAIQEASEFNLIEFESAYPAQVGLLGIQLIWTRDAEDAIYNLKYDRRSMTNANQHFLDILNQLIDVTTLELSKYERIKFETLITIHVHQRDIFDDLCRMHVKSVHDFEWLKQSRFYFKYESNRCRVSITNVDFPYQNEFLGCTDRLVITPLTDRCYITLAQALGMSMGGAPAGPAGTGKTETTKDMGRCLGKFVVVFNCSDQMDYRGLGRIYKGLAQSGSWGCFDEFNRIDLPVLSVAAQQIAIILTCKKEKRNQFIFTDGDVVTMNPEFGLFLTMNPGYAGRQELPENLKINFRTCAMMVPDRGIIMRVKLASSGFQQNVILSKKFYTLYKLCEEQLSKQVHYDFGLRNILSVLRTLGTVKRSSPNDGEPSIVMRVLRDMNLSKLVDEDEALFLSLINDLFPSLALQKAVYDDMEDAIANQIFEARLINHPPWTLKLIQLFETQRVRHGIMTLGPTGAGKTTCISILLKAMTECGNTHKEWRMNPKAITAPQMFGRLDVATNDWTDGIFSTLWRKSLKIKRSENIWIILDGPVDAIWIENLNSVLDDNRTLTLANGDRIPMAANCKLVFEVDVIDNASPATVSRMGMVYMSSSQLDWQPILKAWAMKKPAVQEKLITATFEACFAELYAYTVQALSAKMNTLECLYVRQAIDILEGLLLFSVEEVRESFSLQRMVIFSIMWSLGALLELPDRWKLEEAWRKLPSRLPLPPKHEETSIFDFTVSELGEWVHWSKYVPEYTYLKDVSAEYTSIVVPNVDNVRTDFLISLIATQSKAVLLIGEQGSAKSVIIKAHGGKYNPEQHIFKSFNFSSATTPTMVQRTIESYVDKRVGTSYGPPSGKKMTIFIDDISMPVVNEWGDQVTNEITRQMMETGGFFNLEKPGEFTNLVDVQIIAAMTHPGGGRNDIPTRLKRQFNIFNCTLPTNHSVDKIFGTLALSHFCVERGFSAAVIDAVNQVVPATRRLWQRVKLRMLPTPAKFHYVFNLRDLSRIWQGMLMATSEVISTPAEAVALWKHECWRVIADRFTTQADKDWFERTVKQTAEEDCTAELVAMLPADPLFADFLRDPPEHGGDDDEEGDVEAPKIYEIVTSLNELKERLHLFMNQYNEHFRGSTMDLVFFRDAMSHLLRISRIIRTPRGNALLVGVGGSGKQSLTRLASFIAGYKTFQITLNKTYGVSNLMEDLKTLFRCAGLEGRGVTFIFTDNEIRDEAFLEYLNNVLASGEVSNLFSRDEFDEMMGELIPIMKKAHSRRPPTSENLYNFYLSRVRTHLHVVLCFSPVGEKFRSYALKFPSLISGCTINWFQRWPKDALQAVSRHFLNDFAIVCSPAVKQAMMNMMGDFQDIVAEMSVQYYDRFRRQTSVTPKSYLSFIAGYKAIYTQKRAEIGQLSARMNSGLEKLVEATEAVSDLRKELADKEKELAVASAEADTVLAEVTASAQAAENVKKQVQVVKDKAQSLYDVIMSDKRIAQGKLEAAKPALSEAEGALQTIKPTHIATVRKLGKPPHLIMRIMDCVLLLFQRHLDPVVQDPERPCPKPSWGEALRLMGGNLLQGLLNFPKDSINDETVELMLPYFDMEDYNLETAKKVCGDVAGLCSWTRAMAVFFSINKEVLPLKANLAIQEARLLEAEKRLKVAQAQLDDKQRELDGVMALYNAALTKKQVLIDNAEACRRKMNNAMLLIDGLAGEKIRWTESSRLFEAQVNRLVGDVLLATGFLSYTGPFNQEFREALIKKWKREMSVQRIPYTDELKLIEMLVDAHTTGEWELQGLPNDELSMQNGLIVTKATRFPLLIDPQGQGKTWIKNKEAKNEMQITTLNHRFFRQHLEDALTVGRPLLIEDVGEELDPVLDNVLEKNFVRSGTGLKVKLGDKEHDMADTGFRLYITTKLGNPVYRPEIAARTAIIDFTVTMRGLEDQLLSIVIATEKADLERARKELSEEVMANKKKMKELEDNLLYRLTSTKGSLVEDEELIEVLYTTKSTAQEVKEKLRIAGETEVQITAAREEFRPVAARGSILYFLIVEMSLVNCMYQTSLKQFLGLFENSMTKSAKSPYTNKRILNIISYLTYDVYKYTCRGLYERDKFMFSLQMAIKVQLEQQLIRPEEFQVFLKGGAALDLNAVEAKPKRWITDMTWLNLVALAGLYNFSSIIRQVMENDKAWRIWFDSEAPEDAIMPDSYSTYTTWHKLLLVRSWCPDRAAPMARRYVAEALGDPFAEGVVLNWDSLYAESSNRTPLVALLSTGSDPTDDIERLGKKYGIKTAAISMGQGQEVFARRLLQQSMAEGRFVLLQNCHLGLSFMDELLETLLEATTVAQDFRCWVTTEPHPDFPINLLQMSIKFTNEPPQGVKAGLKRTYAGLTQELLDYTALYQWKPLLYAVAFLHTAVQERRKFGPIGWNIPYEFNQADFTSTVQFMQNHLDDMDPKKGVSWTTVSYMIGEVQYGGRVTDDYDKRLLNTYARVWFCDNIFLDKFEFGNGYRIPKCNRLEEFIFAIEHMAAVDSPECFGLHTNADIIYQTNTANEMLSKIKSIQPKDAGSSTGETREASVYRLAEDMLSKLPNNYNQHEVKERLIKLGHLQPSNIFLRQEIARMENVINAVKTTLTDLRLAIDGTIIMSESLRDALDALFDARIPPGWQRISWDSATLGFWFTELLDRNAQFSSWILKERPDFFWLTGFFNPQGFLTAMRQEIARQHKGWALDTVVLANEVTRMSKEDVNHSPAEGVYVYGLYLEGAGWDRRNSRLSEPQPKVLYTQMPVIWVYAVNAENQQKLTSFYECPVYKKPHRTDLTYIFPLQLRSTKDPDHWTLRGVALLCDTK